MSFGENGEWSLGFESLVPNGIESRGLLSFYSWGNIPPLLWTASVSVSLITCESLGRMWQSFETKIVGLMLIIEGLKISHMLLFSL